MLLLPFLLMRCGVCIAAETAGTEVIRSGRSIQLDGFLIDWQEKTRQPWSGSAAWFHDAAATPEGVAGYCTGRFVTGPWTFYVAARGLSRPPREMHLSDRDTCAGWYCTRSDREANMRTVEWLIPWDSIAVDSIGTYGIHLAGRSDNGESLAPLLLTGRITTNSGKPAMPRMFALRFILMAVMLGLFIGLQFKLRRKPRRRGSLHRSA
jgi:hypothetical protein